MIFFLDDKNISQQDGVEKSGPQQYAIIVVDERNIRERITI